MDKRSSLKKKSFIALAVYLVTAITIIGMVSYLVVEPPIRDQLKQNLDLRTELISKQIHEPLVTSLGVLQSIVSIGSTGRGQEEQAQLLQSLFTVSDGVAVSGGLWPVPYSIKSTLAYSSLFYNRTSDGTVERILSWDNPNRGAITMSRGIPMSLINLRAPWFGLVFISTLSPMFR